MTLLRNLSTDSNDISTASAAGDTVALGKACKHLGTHVSEAQAYAPMPDAETQQHWSAALISYQSSAADCTAAVASSDGQLLVKAGLELGAGTEEVNKASDRIAVISAGS